MLGVYALLRGEFMYLIGPLPLWGGGFSNCVFSALANCVLGICNCCRTFLLTACSIDWGVSSVGKLIY
jgi:hypothetical protein